MAALFGLGAVAAMISGSETNNDCLPIAIRYEAQGAGRGARDAGREGTIVVSVCGILPLTHSAVAIRYQLDVRLTLVAP